MVNLESDFGLPWGAFNKAWRNWSAVHAKQGVKTDIEEFEEFIGANFGSLTTDQTMINRVKMLTGPDHYALIVAHIIRKQQA